MAGQSVCEVTLGNLTVSVDAKYPGLLCDVLVPEGQMANAKSLIGHYVSDRAGYDAILEYRRKHQLTGNEQVEVDGGTLEKGEDAGPTASTESPAPRTTASSSGSAAAAAAAPKVDAPRRPDEAVLMKEIRHLMATDQLDADSGTFDSTQMKRRYY